MMFTSKFYHNDPTGQQVRHACQDVFLKKFTFTTLFNLMRKNDDIFCSVGLY